MSDEDNEKRKILLAALDNLIDFALCEEYQMVKELPKRKDYDEDNYDEYYDDCDDICEKYNKTYADVENDEAGYAMKMAAWWLSVEENTYLTYMTQGDERVRPTHMALEGLSYPKYAFPEWLIPPIDYCCRCFLVEENGVGMSKKSMKDVECKLDKIPECINPVFKESVCKGGRIFSSKHGYFNVGNNDVKKLKTISNKIKNKWLQG